MITILAIKFLNRRGFVVLARGEAAYIERLMHQGATQLVQGTAIKARLSSFSIRHHMVNGMRL